MLDKKQIEVIIDQSGQLKVELSGYVGQACLGVAKEFKEQLVALGLNLESEEITPKPELYLGGVLTETEVTNTAQNRLTQGQN